MVVNQALPEAIARGFALEEIAIFYKRKGAFLDNLQQLLTEAEVPYFLEKDNRFRRTRVVRWLQHLLSFGLGMSDETFPIFFADLADTYRTILLDAGIIDADDILGPRTGLLAALGSLTDPAESLGTALCRLDKILGFSAALGKGPDIYGDVTALDQLRQAVKPDGILFQYTVSDFGLAAKKKGKVVLATHHSSKGRQFNAVIIPELVEQVFPAAPWIGEKLRQERRLFYVAFTRAKKVVLLVSGELYRKANKQIVRTGESRFVDEIGVRLQAGI